MVNWRMIYRACQILDRLASHCLVTFLRRKPGLTPQQPHFSSTFFPLLILLCLLLRFVSPPELLVTFANYFLSLFSRLIPFLPPPHHPSNTRHVLRTQHRSKPHCQHPHGNINSPLSAEFPMSWSSSPAICLPSRPSGLPNNLICRVAQLAVDDLLKT